MYSYFYALYFRPYSSLILNYKYKSKPNKEEKNEKDKMKKTYILNRIKQLSDKKKADYDKMITNLPKSGCRVVVILNYYIKNFIMFNINE